MNELLADFLAETAEGLVELDAALLKLERAPSDGGTLAVAFRVVHTIKGTCGFLTLSRLERVAHAGEDLLGAMREGVKAVTPELISTVLTAVDRMKAIVAAIQRDGVEPAGDDTELLAALAATVTRRAEAIQPGSAPPCPGNDLPDNSMGQTIRVNVASLEILMTLVSELVLTRNQLLQVARSEADSRFNGPLQRLSNLTSDLQEGVMKTRMQPIRHAWNTVPRLVRDLASELGKQIALDMRGEDTELDRHVLELIRGPLTHMVRNCADHGLEPTDVRLAAGKPASGTITLNSYHEGGTVVIEVRDDGAGLATDRIRERALRNQLVSAAELAGWGEQQLNRLIFLPGFTTTDAITAVSGRGVGMDVVLTNIERLGGTVDVDSVRGVGTVFTVRIPLTLAIISALIVTAGGQRFAIPQTCVAELVRVEAHRTAGSDGIAIERVDGTPVLRLRNKLLPLVSLARMLNLPPLEVDGPSTVVVAQLGSLRAGLMVDEVFDTEEIVVKPVSRLLRHIPVFSGNTILGDGSVIMILDPNGLSQAIGQVSAVSTHRPAEDKRAAAERSGDKAAMLLIRLAAGSGLVAVPLGLVARIERIARGTIQRTPDRTLTRYRGQIMPLVEPAETLPEGDLLSVLVFSDRGRSVGVVVAEIVDVVEDYLAIELTSRRPGLLGTASIAGQVTDVLDTGHWLKQGREDWFAKDGGAEDEPSKRILVVEDSAFFRQLLVPALAASGYHVTAVDSAAKALAMRDAVNSTPFDAIISDVEMPGIDGLQFARKLRGGGQWSATPLLALSGRCDPADIGRGAEAGFDEFIGKYDRDGLLAALQRRIPPATRRAA